MDCTCAKVPLLKFFWAASLCMIAAGTAEANTECSYKSIANKVKTISLLRQVENSINTLALAQVDAIADVSTGVHTLELYNDESGFYGPLGGLRKTTDKNETVLGNLDKSIRRLATFSAIETRYEDLRDNYREIVRAGYEVLNRLEADDPAGATRLYASTTVPALNEARAEAYTTMATLERSMSMIGFRCK